MNRKRKINNRARWPLTPAGNWALMMAFGVVLILLAVR